MSSTTRFEEDACKVLKLLPSIAIFEDALGGIRCEIIFLVPSLFDTIFEIRLQFESDLEVLTHAPRRFSLPIETSSRMVIFRGTVEVALKDALRCTNCGGGSNAGADPFLQLPPTANNFSDVLKALRVGDANAIKLFNLC